MFGNCINREGKMIACAHAICLRNIVKDVTVLAFRLLPAFFLLWCLLQYNSYLYS